ncbi:nuclear transport factor 2 family protein [Croceicoccus ponticola]|nr:nuclear transport factor 2 family protein [Croceicoccus ponticola]
MIEGISEQARVLRGFATDFLTSHDVAEVERIMDPDYSLSISGHLFQGRDHDYLPATRAQLEQFPGLVVTVHDTLICEDAVAMRFTEHGVSIRNAGRAASWGGISLFELKDGRLRHGWAEEDYFARKVQLASGQVNPIEAPAPAPWDQPCHAADPEAEEIVRRWLKSLTFLDDPGVVEIGVGNPGCRSVIGPAAIDIDTIFAGGGRAAFHCGIIGQYMGGFEGVGDDRIGSEMVLPVAGMVTLTDGVVSAAHICADRLGASRSLTSFKKG